MGFEYRIKDQYGQYFITCTVHQWVDVFTRKEYVEILLDSLRFCQRQKGLKIYAWVIMTNHIHLIVSSEGELSNIIRDFKKYTATQIFKAIECNVQESRGRWMLWLLRKDKKVWFWEEGYHGEEIQTQQFYQSKIDYIHMNPVRSGFVEKEEDYLLSSAGDFHGLRKGYLTLAE